MRNSPYWKLKKEKGKENQIYRRERLEYAISTHITNKFTANTLITSIQTILDSYEALNSLHKRGNVNSRTARNAIFTIKHFIDSFTDAIEH